MMQLLKYITGTAVGIMLIGSIQSCNKKNHLECIYPNNPIPLRASFVGYFDYDLETIILNQYDKNGKFGEVIRSDTYVYRPFPVVKYDTSELFLDLGNKTDYEIIIPEIDTFKISDIVFEDEKIVEILQGTECPKLEFDQLAQSAKINGITTEPYKKNEMNAFIYLVNSK